MRQYIVTFFLVLGTITFSYGQTDKEEITAVFNDYFVKVEQKDIDGTLDYIYPKIFDLVPRTALQQAFEEAYNDTTVAITMENCKLLNISNTFELKGIKYTLVKYSVIMHMELLEDEAIDETYSLIQIMYGKKNVSIDKKISKISIQLMNNMYAIRDPAFEGWKVLEKKDQMKPILEKLIPQKVIKKL